MVSDAAVGSLQSKTIMFLQLTTDVSGDHQSQVAQKYSATAQNL
jgi:hypothetical protein